MRARIAGKVVAALVMALVVGMPGAAFADKPVEKPFAAAAPFGGVPLWEPGDQFVGISGGSCNGNCPVYELYVFSDGRVVFSGRKDTARSGVWKKNVSPAAYAELVSMLARTQVLDEEIKRKTCLKGRAVLTVMRSAGETGNARSVLLNSGCEGYADLVKEIEGAFIQWADVSKWL